MSTLPNNGLWAHVSLLPNSVLRAVFVGFTVVTNRETDSQTTRHHDICSNTLHLVCVAMRFNINIVKSFAQVCYKCCCGDCSVLSA